MFVEKQWEYKGAPVSSIDVRVMDSEINSYREMHIDRIFHYMQEVASVNLRALEKDHPAMRDTAYAWIVNSISLRLKRLPRMREVVTYSSYPGPQVGVFSYRDYSFKSHQEWLGGASSAWFIADAKNHQPLRLEMVGSGILDRSINELAIGKRPWRFRGNFIMPQYIISYKKRAGFSDTDINGHMSNTRYMAWCMDALQATGTADLTVLGCDINFLAELYAGELVDIYLTPKSMVTAEQRLAWLGQSKALPDDEEADVYVHALKADGSLCFKAQLFFESLLIDQTESAFLTQV